MAPARSRPPICQMRSRADGVEDCGLLVLSHPTLGGRAERPSEGDTVGSARRPRQHPTPRGLPVPADAPSRRQIRPGSRPAPTRARTCSSRLQRGCLVREGRGQAWADPSSTHASWNGQWRRSPRSSQRPSRRSPRRLIPSATTAAPPTAATVLLLPLAAMGVSVSFLIGLCGVGLGGAGFGSRDHGLHRERPPAASWPPA